MQTKHTLLTLTALTAIAAGALTGCSAGGPVGAATTPATAQAAAPSDGTRPDPASSGTADAARITVRDAWVKAATAKDGMSAFFGVVTNVTGDARTIVSASSDAADMVQLHETVVGSGGASTMRQKKGGFPLPAGGAVTLEPGGNHVMLMGLRRELAAGDEASVTFTLDDGSTVDVTAPVKSFAGAQETYAPGEGAESPAGH